MAFKDRISGMFRFGKGKPTEGGSSETASGAAASDEGHTLIPASSEEREALLEELSHGFVHVGQVIERLDDNLSAGTKALESVRDAQERLPALIAEQQHLISEVAQTAVASRQALEVLAEQLQRRDQAQEAMVERLEQLATGMHEQREHHQQQVQ